jgi:hypothetical protein
MELHFTVAEKHGALMIQNVEHFSTFHFRSISGAASAYGTFFDLSGSKLLDSSVAFGRKFLLVGSFAHAAAVFVLLGC